MDGKKRINTISSKLAGMKFMKRNNTESANIKVEPSPKTETAILHGESQWFVGPDTLNMLNNKVALSSAAAANAATTSAESSPSTRISKVDGYSSFILDTTVPRYSGGRMSFSNFNPEVEKLNNPEAGKVAEPVVEDDDRYKSINRLAQLSKSASEEVVSAGDNNFAKKRSLEDLSELKSLPNEEKSPKKDMSPHKKQKKHK